MTKKLLALDCDQVLTDYCSGFIGFAIKQGYSLNINSKFDTYDMSQWFHYMLPYEFSSLIRQYNRQEHPLIFGYLRHVLPKLLEKYEICVVSSYSDDEVANSRRKSILLALGIHNVFLLPIQSSKREVLEEIKPDIYVEDSPKHLQEAIDAGIERVIAMEYPYNVQYVENVTHGTIETIKSLEELL